MTQTKNKNCINCLSSYEPYKAMVNEHEITICEIPDPLAENKGLCPFCNPESFYVKRRNQLNKTL